MHTHTHSLMGLQQPRHFPTHTHTRWPWAVHDMPLVRGWKLLLTESRSCLRRTLQPGSFTCLNACFPKWLQMPAIISELSMLHCASLTLYVVIANECFCCWVCFVSSRMSGCGTGSGDHAHLLLDDFASGVGGFRSCGSYAVSRSLLSVVRLFQKVRVLRSSALRSCRRMLRLACVMVPLAGICRYLPDWDLMADALTTANEICSVH